MKTVIPETITYHCDRCNRGVDMYDKDTPELTEGEQVLSAMAHIRLMDEHFSRMPSREDLIYDSVILDLKIERDQKNR